jgi:predicted enzyme related to lactoylglutathione lyase
LHDQDEKEPRKGSATEVVFPVDNIDEAHEYLKTAGVKICQAPVQVCETPDKIGYSIEFTDPDGNVLSVFGMKNR